MGKDVRSTTWISRGSGRVRQSRTVACSTGMTSRASHGFRLCQRKSNGEGWTRGIRSGRKDLHARTVCLSRTPAAELDSVAARRSRSATSASPAEVADRGCHFAANPRRGGRSPWRVLPGKKKSIGRIAKARRVVEGGVLDSQPPAQCGAAEVAPRNAPLLGLQARSLPYDDDSRVPVSGLDR